MSVVPKRQRVAIFGGDGRGSRRSRTPSHIEVVTYNPEQLHSLIRAYNTGAVDRVVCLVRWISHSQFYAIKRNVKDLIVWSRGENSLYDSLGTLI